MKLEKFHDSKAEKSAPLRSISVTDCLSVAEPPDPNGPPVQLVKVPESLTVSTPLKTLPPPLTNAVPPCKSD